jgi:hypothetical protein
MSLGIVWRALSKHLWQPPFLVLQYTVRQFLVFTTAAEWLLTLTVLCTLFFTILTLYTFAVAIWTFTLAAPYLALAPVCSPQFERRFVMPTVELVSSSLWLIVLVAQAHALSSTVKYAPNGTYPTYATITLATIEWYVLGASIVIQDMISSGLH